MTSLREVNSVRLEAGSLSTSSTFSFCVQSSALAASHSCLDSLICCRDRELGKQKIGREMGHLLLQQLPFPLQAVDLRFEFLPLPSEELRVCRCDFPPKCRVDHFLLLRKVPEQLGIPSGAMTYRRCEFGLPLGQFRVNALQLDPGLDNLLAEVCENVLRCVEDVSG